LQCGFLVSEVRERASSSARLERGFERGFVRWFNSTLVQRVLYPCGSEVSSFLRCRFFEEKIMFQSYQHIEKFGTDEVDGIELGECYVFPKIDGTNSSLWFENGEIHAGSRTRELSTEADNAGFYNSMKDSEKFKKFFAEFPDIRLFGEWLVPHTLKSYKDDAWRQFYVFDVISGEKYLHYNEYKLMLERHDIEYIPPIAIMVDASDEQFMTALEKNTYLIKDGNGVGEGVVVKRYDFVNKFGRTTWAKIVTSEFKERHVKTMGAPIISGELTTERKFIEDFCTTALIEKEFAKLSLDGWKSQKIPQLLGTVYNALVTECTWEAIKKYKYPCIDFGKLNKLCIEKIRKTLTEVF
jgi:hypothetical protein